MLNKDISDSKGYAKLSPSAAVLFCMMVPHYTPYGKMNGDPGYLKGEVCPRISYLTLENIPKHLEEISEYTSVKWFEYDGRMWIHSIKFTSEHQHINMDRVGPDLLPNYSGITPTEVEVEALSLSLREGEEVPKDGPSPSTRKTPILKMANEKYIQHVKTQYNAMIDAPEETAQWRSFYNGTLNIDDLLFAACTWLIEHPEKRRTRLKQFYGNWLRNEFQRKTQRKTVGA